MILSNTWEVFFFMGLWAITIILLSIRIEQVKKLKLELKLKERVE